MTQWFDHNGVGLHWREDGNPEGSPILLLNSLGTDLRLWDGIMPHLSDYRVIRMDMRGHGLSDAPVGPYSLDLLSGDAMALIDYLGLKRLSLAGVSIGGMIAQDLSARMSDRIERVVLSNTALRMGTPKMWADRMAAVQSEGLESIADSIVDRWFSPGFRSRPEIGLWRNMLLRTSPTGYVGCCSALAKADLSEIAPQITCPAFVLGGGDDGASPPDIVRELSDMINGGLYAEFSGVGHLPMAEAPDRFIVLVAAFLKGNAHVS